MKYRARILIVDDEPLMCESLKLLLNTDGYDVQTTSQAQQTLELFSKDDFDLVLLDVNLPEINGLQLIDHIKQYSPETFIIMMTGQASVDTTIASLRKGAFDYLRKPFEHEKLLNTVNNAVNQKKLQRDRRHAEEKLRKAHEELEKRVEERTTELALANAKLRQEIEERKRAELKLQQTNEEVKNFVQVVSHDLKNPIISIQGFSSRLIKNYKEILGEKGLRYLEHIMTNSHRMELLVSDLLTLSMIGRVELKFKEISCHKLVKNLTSNLQTRLKAKGIELFSNNNLPTISCDGERLYQVFENLLVNAIKFIDNSRTPRIEIGYSDNGKTHVFHVKDNGIGIDSKHHRQIFEMFSRLKEIEDEEGTGLGLPIVHKIVSSLGGKVWVESEKGNGAAFYFSLPKDNGV